MTERAKERQVKTVPFKVELDASELSEDALKAFMQVDPKKIDERLAKQGIKRPKK